MKTLFTLFIIIVTPFSLLWSTGSSAAQFLQIQPGARSGAVGGSYVSVVEDGESLYWNPAGLASVKSKEINLSHMVYLQGMNHSYISYSEPSRNSGVFSLGLIALYSDRIKLTEEDELGYLIDTGDSFRSLETAFIYGWGKSINNYLDVGISGKYISQTINGENASGYAADIGLKYKLSENLHSGMNIQHLGPPIKGRDLPVNLKVGVSFKIPEKLMMIVFDLNQPLAGKINLGVGAEKRLYEKLSLRAGYNSRPDSGGISGLTSGVGLDMGKINLDYAFVPYGMLGNAHQITVRTNF